MVAGCLKYWRLLIDSVVQGFYGSRLRGVWGLGFGVWFLQFMHAVLLSRRSSLDKLCRNEVL